MKPAYVHSPTIVSKYRFLSFRSKCFDACQKLVFQRIGRFCSSLRGHGRPIAKRLFQRILTEENLKRMWYISMQSLKIRVFLLRTGGISSTFDIDTMFLLASRASRRSTVVRMSLVILAVWVRYWRSFLTAFSRASTCNNQLIVSVLSRYPIVWHSFIPWRFRRQKFRHSLFAYQ